MIDGTATALLYSEGEGTRVIDNAITISDVDDTDMEGATVQITGNYQNGEDELAFANQPGITGAWDAVTGILTLTGTASIADYEVALALVTYENTSNAPDPGDRSRQVYRDAAAHSHLVGLPERRSARVADHG